MITAYHQPTRLDEALLLVSMGATPVAGATALYSAKSQPDGDLCDVTRLGLGTIQVEETRMTLGATVTLTQIVQSPDLVGMPGALLRRAASSVTSRPMRNVITLGGNVAHVAYWADMPVVLLALDAFLEMQWAKGGTSFAPIGDCLRAAKPPWAGGLITAIRIPLHKGRWGFGHERFSRTVNDYPLVTACATLRRDGDVARDVHLVLGALQPRAFRVTEVETMLEGKALDAKLLAEAARKVSEGVPVGPNFRASADFRREIAGVLARRTLEAAFSMATQEQ
jgi:CO/xanthine dehydrogenase FAD-binding subunit